MGACGINQTPEQERVKVIGLGEFQVTSDPNTVLVCLGLGSCVALCAYDPFQKVGGMAHMVLPSSSEGRNSGRDAKFVDQAIPLLLQGMEHLGAARLRMIVKMAGGAHMITAPGFNGMRNIGDRNAEATRAILATLGLRLQGEDTGGSHGRTVRLYVSSGRLTVSTAGGPSREL